MLSPKYIFAPTRIPTITVTNSVDSFPYGQDEMTKNSYYGFLGGVGAKMTLSLEEVGKVIKVVGKELEQRGESWDPQREIMLKCSFDYANAVLESSVGAELNEGESGDSVVH
jgi:hypothetical protein